MGKTFIKLALAFFVIIASLGFVLWFTQAKMSILREELNSRKSYDEEIILINTLFVDIENFYLLSNKFGIEHKSLDEAEDILAPKNSNIQKQIEELQKYSRNKDYTDIVDSIESLYQQLANNAMELILLQKLAATSFDKPLLMALNETNLLLKQDTSFVKKKEVISEKELKKIERQQQKLLRQEKRKQKKDPNYNPAVTKNNILEADSSLFAKIDSALVGLSRIIIKEQTISDNRKEELNQKIYEVELSKHFIYQRINNLLSQLRNEEQLQLNIRINNATQYSQDAFYWLTVIFIVTSIAAIIFFALIIYDLSKSNYFRKKLIIEKNKAEKLAKDKENFLNKMSHEIRTPLNAIVGFSQILMSEKDANKTLQYAQQIQSSSTHLLNLINETLDFTRIESGFAQPKIEEFDSNKAIQNVISELQILAQKKNLELKTNIQPAKNTVFGDVIWLRQILYNIIGNSIKYTEKGSIEVASTWQLKDGNKSLILTVKDTGIGMSEEQVKALFDVYKKDFQPSISSGSSGLGLAITKKMIDLQAGTIHVHSKKGEGSIFTIEIPYKIGQPLNNFKNTETPLETPNLAQKNILIIDDDIPSLMLLEILLKKWNGKIEKAHNVEEAIELISNQPFDYIISDWNLKSQTADKILQFIAKEEIKTPIIIASADNQIKQNIDEFPNLKIAIVPKPISPNVLTKQFI